LSAEFYYFITGKILSFAIDLIKYWCHVNHTCVGLPTSCRDSFYSWLL